jgi:hypothetical protein
MRSTTYCVRELEECYDDSAGQGLRQPTVTWGVPGELRKRGGIVVGGHHFLSGVTVADPRPLRPLSTLVHPSQFAQLYTSEIGRPNIPGVAARLAEWCLWEPGPTRPDSDNR